MKTMTFWFYDVLALTGAGLLLAGIFLHWGLAPTMMATGLLLIAMALRLFFMTRNEAEDEIRNNNGPD